MKSSNLLTFPHGDAAPRLADLRRELATAGRRVWLAGLGLAGELADLDAASRRWVDGLAERGKPLAERRRREALRLADRANDRLAGAGRRLEDGLRDGIRGALDRLGVPGRQEIDRLTACVASLDARLDDLAARDGGGEHPNHTLPAGR